MNLALVYDRINKWGGAERLLASLHQLWPQAPVYTGVYNPKTTLWAKTWDIRPSFINHLPGAKTNHEPYFWLMPLGLETLDLKSFNTVLSVSADFTKGVLSRPQQLHVSYVLSPTRYLWLNLNEYKSWSRGLGRLLLPPVLSYLRHWDYLAAQRPDVLFTISHHVRHQIQKYYHRDATVIYPPVDTDFFKPAASGYALDPSSYFLIVSRLVPHKHIKLAIEAFNQLKLPLKIIGTGRAAAQLKRLAKPNIKFLGQLTDLQVLEYYQSCQALIFPGCESFGLTMIEAQACGKPVIALNQGAAKEIIINGKTGILFHQSTISDLVAAVKSFAPAQFSWQDCRLQAEKFSLPKFNQQFKTKMANLWNQHLKTL